MGDAQRRKLLKPKKIRERSNEEISGMIRGYKYVFPIDAFRANLLWFCGELSEYYPISMSNEKDLDLFIKENMDTLVDLFVQRFKDINENILNGLAQAKGKKYCRLKLFKELRFPDKKKDSGFGTLAYPTGRYEKDGLLS